MCIILYKPAGISYSTLLNRRLIQECQRDNPDGFGTIWMKPDGFTTAVQFLHRDPFEYLSENIELDYTGHEIALHFRFATHGNISYDNLHPFGNPKTGYWMHNGVLPVQPANCNNSDSLVYYQNVIEPVIRNSSVACANELDELKDCLECLTPANSRFLFMCSTISKHAILTGNGWVQDDITGLWFSNGGYL